MPIATKKSTASRSRKGSSRRRASADDGAFRDREAADERREGQRHAEDHGPEPGDRQPGTHRHDQECVVLVSQAVEDDRKESGDRDRQDREHGDSHDRGFGRPSVGAEGGQQDRRKGHAGHVLDDAPAEERVLGRLVRRSPTAAGDVHDHDGRRQRDAQSKHPAGQRGNPGNDDGHTGDRRREHDLERRDQEDPAVLPPEPEEVHLDSHFEQEEDHAHVGKELDLLAVRDEPGREGRHRDAEQQVADDGRQAESPGDPAECHRGQQDHPELQDRRCAFHRRIVCQATSVEVGRPV